MVSWRMENSLHSTNIRDTANNMVAFCSVYQVPSYDPCLALLAPVLKEVAYLCMLFILEVSCQAVQVISRIDNAFKKPKVAAYDQSEIELS